MPQSAAGDASSSRRSASSMLQSTRSSRSSHALSSMARPQAWKYEPMSDGFSLGRYLDIVRRTDPLPLCGRVTRTVGLVVESSGPRASVGELCILHRDGRSPLPMEVVGFRDGALLTVPLGGTAGIRPGDRLVARGTVASAAVGDALIGRVIDGLGNPLDGLGPLGATTEYPLQPVSINPLAREPIAAPLGTGVRAIDGLLTC